MQVATLAGIAGASAVMLPLVVRWGRLTVTGHYLTGPTGVVWRRESVSLERAERAAAARLGVETVRAGETAVLIRRHWYEQHDVERLERIWAARVGAAAF